MKVVTLSAVAKVVVAFIGVVFDSSVKQITRFFDLITYLGQIDKSKGGAIFLYQVF